MRITQKILFSNFMRDINKNRSQLGEVQSDLSSGRRVRIPSQDPVAFQRSRVIEENIRKEEQFQSNINTGLRTGRLAQESLEETIDRLIEVKSIVVQGASESSDAGVRANMADEIAGIRDSLVNTLNISYGDRYLFAGTNSAVRPFEYDGAAPGGVADTSNNVPTEVLVAEGVTLESSVTGEDLRATGAGDLFEIIDNIEQALRTNDTQAINDSLPEIDQSVDHVTELASRLGSNINRMEFMFEQYESSRIVQQSNVSNLVDTNFAQSFSELRRIQVSFESAMAVHSTMFNNTLLDYL